MSRRRQKAAEGIPPFLKRDTSFENMTTPLLTKTFWMHHRLKEQMFYPITKRFFPQNFTTCSRGVGREKKVNTSLWKKENFLKNSKIKHSSYQAFHSSHNPSQGTKTQASPVFWLATKIFFGGTRSVGISVHLLFLFFINFKLPVGFLLNIPSQLEWPANADDLRSLLPSARKVKRRLEIRLRSQAKHQVYPWLPSLLLKIPLIISQNTHTHPIPGTLKIDRDNRTPLLLSLISHHGAREEKPARGNGEGSPRRWNELYKDIQITLCRYVFCSFYC